MSEITENDVREQEARIQQLQRDPLLKEWDSVKRAQNVRCAPITLVVASAGATAALLGAAGVFLKWFVR